MFYIDSHCHLNESRLYQEADRIIDSAYEAGVKTLLVVGWDFESSVQAVELASRRDGVYAAIGFHPENLDGVNEDAISRIVELASNKKVIAIGEIGLDYYPGCLWHFEGNRGSEERRPSLLFRFSGNVG